MTNKYTLEVQKDEETGELFFEFPDALLNQMGWDAGDTLVWEEMHDASWCLSLTKKEENEDTNNGTSGVGEDTPS